MAIQHQMTKGALIRLHHGVYAVGRLPTTPLDRAHGALLAAGARSALAGRTALALWRSERDWPDALELVSARDVRLDGLTIRRSKTLLKRDIRRVQGLRVTSPARTALDLAARVARNEMTEDELTRIVNDLRHVNRLRIDQLRDVVARNPRHPGARHLKHILGDAQRQPTRSQLEDAFMRMLKRHKLPIPQINVMIGGVEVDNYYPDERLIVELDGREVTHADDWRPAFENDRARVVDVMAKTGIPTIRFTYDQTTRRHRESAARLRRILETRKGLGRQGARTP